MPATSPALAAWEIGVRLRRARKEAELTTVEAAKTIGISQNYVSNFEHGRRNISEDKIRLLSSVYGMTSGEADKLIQLRAALDKRGWWHSYNGILGADFIRFVGYEQGAARVKTYENSLVSGLLQTESYARAVFRGDTANLRMAEVERRVEVRMKRQELLSGSDPLEVTVVMSEAALYQQVGGTGVLAEQLHHLLKLVKERSGNLELRVVPFTAQSHGALSNSTFHILEFPVAELPDLAWHEHGIGMDLVDDQPRVHQYSATFEEALNYALDVEETQDLIERALQRLT